MYRKLLFLLLACFASCSKSGGGSGGTPRVILGEDFLNLIVPADGEVGVSKFARVYAGFTEAVSEQSLNQDSFLVYRTVEGFSGKIEGAVAYDALTHTAVFTPSSELNEETQYSVFLAPGIESADGKILDSSVEWSFTTKEQTPPVILSSMPTNGETGVVPNIGIQIEFNEALDPASLTVKTLGKPGNFNLFRTAAPTIPIPGTIEYVEGSSQVIFHPTPLLLPLTSYTFTVLGVEDVFDNPTTELFSIEFTVKDYFSANLSTPLDAASDVSLDTNISVTFNGVINPSTVNATVFTVSGGVTTNLPISFSNGNRTATFTPAAALDPFTTYTVSLEASISDTQGLTLGAPVSFSFTTGSTVPTWDVANSLDSALSLADSTSYQLYQSSNGDTFAIWAKSGGIFANRKANGANWESPVQLNQSSDGPNAISPAIAADGNGNAMAVWIQGTNFENNTNPGKSYVLKYFAGSGWQAPADRQQISQNGSPVHSQARISMNSAGHALISWRRFTTTGSRRTLRSCRFTPDPALGFAGGTNNGFGSDAKVQPQATPLEADNTRIVIDSNPNNPTAIAIWTQTGTTPGSHVFYNRYTGGNAWPSTSFSALDIDSNNVDVDSMQLKMDLSGNAFATWSQGAASARNVYAARYNGTGWSPTLLLENQSNDARFPSLAVSESLSADALVVWQQADGVGNANNIYYNRYNAANNSWMPTGVKVTSHNPSQVALPAIAMLDSAGNAMALWREKTSASSVWQIYASKFTAANTSWATTVNLCADNVNNADLTSFVPPQIVATSNHSPVAIWNQNTAGTFSLWANIYR